MVLKNILFVPYYWIMLNWYAAHVDRYTEEQRYAMLKKIDHAANRGGNLHIDAHGVENIPSENGFIFYPNHQGLYDVLAIMEVCPVPFSVVAKKEVGNVPFLKQVFACMKAFLIDREDIKQSMQVIINVTKEVKAGRNYLIFAEGTRSKNGNHPQEFKGGSFKAAMKAKCPIVPVALIDSYKAFDTGSAVAAVPALDRNFAYLSSGTWSLMGVETDAPVITAETEALNFTNEGGVEGTIRLLKNICGMWLLERCRLNWGDTSYPELITEADSCEPFRSLINPDDDCFANPADMEQAIREYCRTTGQPVPEQRGQIVRCIFESLALRYRQVLENLRALSPRPIETLHVIGGGSRNDLLNQFTANAIGIPVVAGPSEATAIGNVMIQAMTVGEATDVAGMRQLINRSIPLKTYQPQDTEAWDASYIHFKNCVR